MDKTNIKLASTASMRTSLEAIRNGDAGLNEKRKLMLQRVPDPGDWAAFRLNHICNKDLAYLSAATHNEFALIRGKDLDILFHGTLGECAIPEDIIAALKTGKYTLVCHSHPDYEMIIPSAEDRYFLKCIGQKESTIISYITGEEQRFSIDFYKDFLKGGTEL